MGKGKKERTIRKRKEKELATKRSKRNKIIIYGSLAVLTVAALTTNYFGKTTGKQPTNLNQAVSTSLKEEFELPNYNLLNIEDYINSVETIEGNDQTRTLYIISQSHKLDRLQKGLNYDKIIPIQIAIYRIIEYLHTQKNLEFITREGADHKMLFDKIPTKKYEEGRKDALPQNLGDELLMDILEQNQELSGVRMAFEFYPSLIGAGWEHKELLKHTRSLSKFIWELQKGNNSAINDRKLDGIKKYFNANEALVDTLSKTKIIESLFEHANSQRDKFCFYNSINLSDSLFYAGVISNRDVATVIGTSHIKNLRKLIKGKLYSNKYAPNIQIIHPKGVRIYK